MRATLHLDLDPAPPCLRLSARPVRVPGVHVLTPVPVPVAVAVCLCVWTSCRARSRRTWCARPPTTVPTARSRSGHPHASHHASARQAHAFVRTALCPGVQPFVLFPVCFSGRLPPFLLFMLTSLIRPGMNQRGSRTLRGHGWLPSGAVVLPCWCGVVVWWFGVVVVLPGCGDVVMWWCGGVVSRCRGVEVLWWHERFVHTSCGAAVLW